MVIADEPSPGATPRNPAVDGQEESRLLSWVWRNRLINPPVVFAQANLSRPKVRLLGFALLGEERYCSLVYDTRLWCESIHLATFSRFTED